MTGYIGALAGAVGFCTRIPIGQSESGWEALASRPAAMVPVAYLLGAIIAAVVVLPLPTTIVIVLFPAWIVVWTGINHLDGIADCGDATAAHGTMEERRAILQDTDLGVGGMVALFLVLAGLAVAGYELTAAPAPTALGVVIAAEVGAKFGMVLLATLGSATHEGLGSAMAEPATASDLLLAGVLTVPVVAITVPAPTAAVALGGAVLASLAMLWWGRQVIGGISGDVFGATNEIARVTGLHAGVIAWTML